MWARTDSLLGHLRLGGDGLDEGDDLRARLLCLGLVLGG